MSVADPTPELLLAYALDALSAEQSDAVRRWLLVQTDERVLEAYRAAQAEAEQRRTRLAYWAARSVRARVDRAMWRARARVADALALSIEAADAPRGPALAPLRSAAAHGAPSLVVEVSLGFVVDLVLRPSVPGVLAAFALDGADQLHVLREAKLVAAGTRIELAGFVLEDANERFDVYVVFSPSSPITMPAPDDGPTWLADLLEQLAARSDVTFLHRVFVPRLARGSRKQP